MKAIITTSIKYFQAYCRLNELQENEVKQVCRLTDIIGVDFTEAVEIEGYQNVTDYVINKVRNVTSRDNYRSYSNEKQ